MSNKFLCNPENQKNVNWLYINDCFLTPQPVAKWVELNY